MFVNGERERERWGGEHDTPHAHNNVGHDTWNDYSNSYNYECVGYEHEYDYDEGEGYEGGHGYEYNCDPIGAKEEPSTYVYDNPSVHRQGEPASEPVTYVDDDPYVHRRSEPANTGGPVSFPLSIHNSGEPDSRPAEARSTLDYDRAETPISFPISRSRKRAERTGCGNDQGDDIHTKLVVGLQDERLERNDDILPHHANLIVGLQEEKSERDDDIPSHPPVNSHYLQKYDRTNGTQSAPPLMEWEERRGKVSPTSYAYPNDSLKGPGSEGEVLARAGEDTAPDL